MARGGRYIVASPHELRYGVRYEDSFADPRKAIKERDKRNVAYSVRAWDGAEVLKRSSAVSDFYRWYPDRRKSSNPSGAGYVRGAQRYKVIDTKLRRVVAAVDAKGKAILRNAQGL